LGPDRWEGTITPAANPIESILAAAVEIPSDADRRAAPARILARASGVCLYPRRFRWAFRIAATVVSGSGFPRTSWPCLCRRSEVPVVEGPTPRAARHLLTVEGWKPNQ
jgi:hypothetical protein